MFDQKTIQDAAKLALQVQDAVNLTGVLNSWAGITSVLWREAEKQGEGTEWVNKHPINFLFAAKVSQLTNLDDSLLSFERAYDFCKAIANKPPEKYTEEWINEAEADSKWPFYFSADLAGEGQGKVGSLHNREATEVLRAKGVIADDSMTDSERDCTYVYFKTREDAEAFISRLNEYVFDSEFLEEEFCEKCSNSGITHGTFDEERGRWVNHACECHIGDQYRDK